MPLLAQAARASSSESISPTGVALGVAEVMGLVQAAMVRVRSAMANQFNRVRCMDQLYAAAMRYRAGLRGVRERLEGL